MTLFELLESMPEKKTVKVPATPVRNYVAKNSPTTGAGSHTDKKYSRKEKHKSSKRDE